MTKEEVKNLWLGDVIVTAARGLKFVVEERKGKEFKLRLLSDRGTVTKQQIKLSERAMLDFDLVPMDREVDE